MRKHHLLRMVIVLMFLLTACRTVQKEEASAQSEKMYKIFYLNKEETKIEGEDYVPVSSDTKGLIDELCRALASDPENLKLKKTLGSELSILSCTMDGNQLMIDFDSNYLNLKHTTEILFRAAVVRTMNQAEGVECISFQVDSAPLTDREGNMIGVMTADMFIDNAGNEINAYEKTNLTLYFANEDGTALVPEVEEVIYSSNISMEKLVIEKLLEGPKNDHLRATLPPDRKVSSITVKDGICYVNFEPSNQEIVANVSEEVSVYSIVNSLSEIKNVNKVQILIDGESDRMFRESISLSNVFERNLDIVEQ